MGRLERIWVKRAHRGPMDLASRAQLDSGGIVGNADRGGSRPVTIISAERWAEAEASLAAELDPSVRRANLLVSGVDLAGSRCKVLGVGACHLRIGGETRPCRLMDDQHAGLQGALDERWGGGAYATVEQTGSVTVGDEVGWEAG